MTFFRTIRSKLLASFGIFIIINFVVILINLIFDAQRSRIDEVILTLNQVESLFQQVNQLEKDFFNDETINPQYYETGVSRYLEKREAKVEEIQQQLEQLIHSEDIDDFGIKSDLAALSYHLDRYEDAFESLLVLIRRRGFKDYGIEGTMREHIHDIEDVAPPLDLAKVLMIRRHEKDFILRKQPQYIEKLNNAVAILAQDVRNRIPNPVTQRNLIDLLESYRSTFNELVTLERRIGFSKRQGARGDLFKIANLMDTEITKIDRKITTRAEEARQNIFIASLSVMGVSLIAGVLIAVLITRILSRPIYKLSTTIRDVIKANFQTPPQNVAEKVDTNDEIGLLAKDFGFMLGQVQESIEEVQSKSEKIEEKQKLLLDSIRYAQKIQSAFLPHEDNLKTVLQDYFILYEPLHVVSGDFYWVAQKHGRRFFAVVDCTGHGVPGAFMSMIGSSLLNKIILQEQVFDLAEVLEHLHQEVKTTLNQDKQNETDDGMEACLCMIEPSEGEKVKLSFAGARTPLYVSQEGTPKVKRVKGTKRAIGGKHKSEMRPFQHETLWLEKGQMLYLTSDGFADQHNSNKIKYGKRGLQKLFERIADMPASIQHDVVREELYTHMKGQVQRDDITVMGVRL